MPAPADPTVDPPLPCPPPFPCDPLPMATPGVMPPVPAIRCYRTAAAARLRDLERRLGHVPRRAAAVRCPARARRPRHARRTADAALRRAAAPAELRDLERWRDRLHGRTLQFARPGRRRNAPQAVRPDARALRHGPGRPAGRAVGLPEPAIAAATLLSGPVARQRRQSCGAARAVLGTRLASGLHERGRRNQRLPGCAATGAVGAANSEGPLDREGLRLMRDRCGRYWAPPMPGKSFTSYGSSKTDASTDDFESVASIVLASVPSVWT